MLPSLSLLLALLVLPGTTALQIAVGVRAPLLATSRCASCLAVASEEAVTEEPPAATPEKVSAQLLRQKSSSAKLRHHSRALSLL